MPHGLDLLSWTVALLPVHAVAWHSDRLEQLREGQNPQMYCRRPHKRPAAPLRLSWHELVSDVT